MRILGISPFHDGSVCVINDGKIEYFCKQERLTRIKRDSFGIEYTKTLDFVFSLYKQNIDVAIICSPSPGHVFIDALLMWIANNYDGNMKIIKYCDKHHLAHASLAFYNSGFDKSLCLVIDRNGARVDDRMRESETVFTCEYPAKINPIYKSYFYKNIGEKYDVENHKSLEKLKEQFKDCEIVADSMMNITKVYEAATTLIGQNILENGKTMGLSAYGKDKPFEKLFLEHRPNDKLFTHYEGNEVAFKEYVFKQSKEVPKGDTIYSNLAYQVQKQTQEEVLHLVKKYVEKTNIKNVCLSGGYALNVVTNEYLIKNLPDVNFYFEPLADDSGNSLGASLHYYYEQTGDKQINKLEDTFFNHLTDGEQPDGVNVTVEEIAKHLSEQKIVAVKNGYAETGPRALGNRSILFDARNKDAKDIVNKVKKREWYRPFACSVLKEDAKKYFNMYHLDESKFMTISFPVLNKDIPGVTHIDNSCRIQTVDEDIPHLYNLLKEFKKITNVPVLLNTSFNLAGEPLVETTKDALKTFNETDIDILWFPDLGKAIFKSEKKEK